MIDRKYWHKWEIRKLGQTLHIKPEADLEETNYLLPLRLTYVIWCDISLHKHDKLNYRKLRITEIVEIWLEWIQDMQTYSRWGPVKIKALIQLTLLNAFWVNEEYYETVSRAKQKTIILINNLGDLTLNIQLTYVTNDRLGCLWA